VLVIYDTTQAGHPYPETFADYLMTGYSFAEAANVADPTALWQGLYVGDPLYCPMRGNKVAALDTTAPPASSLACVGGDGVDETYRLTIDTTGSDPDLLVASGTHGRAPIADKALVPNKVYSQ